MKAIDQLIYKYYTKDVNIKGVDENQVFEAIDWFYKGIEPTDEIVSLLSMGGYSDLIKKATLGNLLRSVNVAQVFLTEVINLINEKQDLRKKENQQLNQLGKHSGLFDENLSQEELEGIAQEACNSSTTRGKVGEVLEECQTVEDAMGVTAGSSDDRSGNAEAAMEFFNKMKRNPTLRDLMKWFGIFSKHISKIKRERLVVDYANRTSVTLGNDIRMLLPSNLLLLNDVTDDYFNYLYAKRSLLQFDPVVNAPVGKGDMAIMLDVSSSMYNSPRTRDTLLNKYSCHSIVFGLALAMIKSLKDDGRNAQVFSFNSALRFEFDSNKMSMKDVIESVAGIMIGGGTEIVNNTLNVWRQYNDHDIIILSDLEFGYYQSENLPLLGEKKLDRRLFALTLNSAGADRFEPYCDGVASLENLDNVKEFCTAIL